MTSIIVASISFVAKNDIPRAVKSKNTIHELNCSDARIRLAEKLIRYG